MLAQIPILDKLIDKEQRTLGAITNQTHLCEAKILIMAPNEKNIWVNLNGDNSEIT